MRPTDLDECASADLWQLLALTASEPGADHADMFAALGLDAPRDIEALRAAHAQAFVTQCVPYASIYVGVEGAIGGEAAARVADFRRLLGSVADRTETQVVPDHLPDLLADYAELAALADDPRARHARKAFFWEHLACWLMPFCDALMRSAVSPFDAWGTLLAQVLRADALALGLPAQLPLHLREAPAGSVGADADSSDVAARTLFVPAATGMVLTRSDLVRAAKSIDGQTVPGSRAFMLRTLFDQDVTATLEWLAAEAVRQADARSVELDVFGDIARFWRDRALASDQGLIAMADVAATTTRGVLHA
ncbi:MAG: molecular chaperone TorD family protein [Salinisphaera sp.]|jgi:TorA maturation chaperone TorD|nr:molecular chaperone TorD family protein [Salinisphaera sp.]